MVDSDSDNVGNLLKDIDDMDDEFLGRKKDGKHAVPRRGLSNIDDLFGDSQKGKKSRKNIDDFFPTKKPTVSFLDELGDDELHEREHATAPSKAKMSEHPKDVKSTPTDQPARVRGRTTSDMDDIFGPAPRRATSISAGKTTGSSPLVGNMTKKAVESERFYGSNRPGTNQKSPAISPRLEQFAHDRMQRLENEIDRLNREIDALKRKQLEREEALNEEWKEKLKRRERQHEEELVDLEETQKKQLNRLKSDHAEVLQSIRETFHEQIEAIMEGQKESKNYEEMLKKVDELTAKIGEVSTHLNDQVDKSSTVRNEYISMREQQLEIREERIKKEEEWLAKEKQQVGQLNLKLQSLYDNSEQNALQEKWRIREERQKLNAEKEAFKNEQLKILDAAEQQRIEIESSKSSFLRQQQDLIIRVVAAKSSLEAEKSAFDAQRDRDVFRLKVEAEQLENKLKQVQNAEDILQNTQRICEQKYQQLVALERALIDECFELERCRKQMETIQTDIRKKTNVKNEQIHQHMAQFMDTNASDFIVDPYTDEKPSRREKESYDAILKMHAGTLENAGSFHSLNSQA